MNIKLIAQFQNFSEEELIKERDKRMAQLCCAVEIENEDELYEELEVINYLLASDENE